MQPISDAARDAFAANPAPEQNLASAPPITRPMPRLGRGIVWPQIVAEIEAEQLERESAQVEMVPGSQNSADAKADGEQAARELPPLPATPPIAMHVAIAREVLGAAEPRIEDEILAALTGDAVPPPPPPSTPLEDVRAYVRLVETSLTPDIPVTGGKVLSAEPVERTGWLARAIARLRR